MTIDTKFNIRKAPRVLASVGASRVTLPPREEPVSLTFRSDVLPEQTLQLTMTVKESNGLAMVLAHYAGAEDYYFLEFSQDNGENWYHCGQESEADNIGTARSKYQEVLKAHRDRPEFRFRIVRRQTLDTEVE